MCVYGGEHVWAWTEASHQLLLRRICALAEIFFHFSSHGEPVAKNCFRKNFIIISASLFILHTQFFFRGAVVSSSSPRVLKQPNSTPSSLSLSPTARYVYILTLLNCHYCCWLDQRWMDLTVAACLPIKCFTHSYIISLSSSTLPCIVVDQPIIRYCRR